MPLPLRIPVLLLLRITPLLLLLCSCNEPPPEMHRPDDGAGPHAPAQDLPTPPLTPRDSLLSAATARFGFELFRVLHEAAPEDNLVLSPMSIATALAMAMVGSAGETQAAFQTTLHLNDFAPSDVATAYAASRLAEPAGDTSAVTLRVANALWHRDDVTLKPAFLGHVEQRFEGHAEALPFEDPATVERINAWVREHTGGRIDEIVEHIDRQTVLFLLNAVYFRGRWLEAFDEAATAAGSFATPSGTTVAAQMMHRTASLPYHEAEDAQAVDLLYGDSLHTMTILLPRPSADADAFFARFDAARWARFRERLAPRPVDLYLPRLELDYDALLNAPLAALGLGIAFTPGRADFSGISEGGRLYLSRVRHRTSVEVTEAGTEAAAATSAELSTVMAPAGPPPVLVRADRPFLFVIHRRGRAAPLFIGKVARPQP